MKKHEINKRWQNGKKNTTLSTSRVVKIIRSMEEKYMCHRSCDCCRKAITRSPSIDLTISGTCVSQQKIYK